jgi:hypothetical protein
VSARKRPTAMQRSVSTLVYAELSRTDPLGRTVRELRRLRRYRPDTAGERFRESAWKGPS